MLSLFPSPDALTRFLAAQEPIYDTALRELQAGQKETHWMWYIFPQLRGLGQSHNSTLYGIEDEYEARAYLADPVLGARLKECCTALLQHADKSADEILGDLDALKLQSSMTLFAYISEEDSLFHQVLAHFYLEQMDKHTVALLEQAAAERRKESVPPPLYPAGVQDLADWASWTLDLYRRGKRPQEIRTTVHAIEILLNNGYSEERLKKARYEFEALPDGMSFTNTELMMTLLLDSSDDD